MMKSRNHYAKMKMLLHKFSVSPVYYAVSMTLAGLVISFASWLASAHINNYMDTLSRLNTSWVSALGIAGVILTIFSLGIYDKLTRRRSLKVSRFFDNQKIMWQLVCFLLSATVITSLMIIFEEFISIHFELGLGMAYVSFSCYFIFSFLRMLFTDK